MKTVKVLLLIISLIFSKKIAAQDNEKIVVPLAQPGKAGYLEVNLFSGSIKVTGYSGKEVIVIAESKETDHEEHGEKKEAQGMKRIKNNSMELEVEEKDNKVEVRSNSMQNMNLTIQVPYNFSLNLKTVNEGDLIVENVTGEIEADNVNGEIKMKDIGGSAVLNTVNGGIDVFFKEIDKGKPMAFTTLNGDLNISFPADIKSTIKMRSEMGEIYTDFDIQPSSNAGKVEKVQDGKGTKYKLEKWITGNVNGGGPEYTFKTMNGNIYIKKRK